MRTRWCSIMVVALVVGLWAVPRPAGGYYDPGIQRWINRDPAADEASVVYSVDALELNGGSKARHSSSLILSFLADPNAGVVRVNLSPAQFGGNSPISNSDAFGLDFSSCWANCMDDTSNLASKCLSGAAAANGIGNGLAGYTGRRGIQGVRSHATSWQHRLAGGRGGLIGKFAKGAGRFGVVFTVVVGGWDSARILGCAFSCGTPLEAMDESFTYAF